MHSGKVSENMLLEIDLELSSDKRVHNSAYENDLEQQFPTFIGTRSKKKIIKINSRPT